MDSPVNPYFDRTEKPTLHEDWDTICCPYCQTKFLEKLALRKGLWLMICWTCTRLLDFNVEAFRFVTPPSVLDVNGNVMHAD